MAITYGTYKKILRELELQGKIDDDTPLIYSSDDEGNSFHVSIIGPEPLQVREEDLDKHYIEEAIGIYGNVKKGFKKVLCIN